MAEKLTFRQKAGKVYNSMMSNSSIAALKWLSILLNFAEIISLSEAAIEFNNTGWLRAYARFTGMVLLDMIVALSVDAVYSNNMDRRMEKLEEGEYIDWIECIKIAAFPVGVLFMLNVFTTSSMYMAYLESIEQFIFIQHSGNPITILTNVEFVTEGPLIEKLQARNTINQSPSISVWGPMIASLIITLINIYKKTAEYSSKGLIRGIDEKSLDFRHFIKGNPLKMFLSSLRNMTTSSDVTWWDEIVKGKLPANNESNSNSNKNSNNKSESSKNSKFKKGYFNEITNSKDTVLNYVGFLAKVTNLKESTLTKEFSQWLGINNLGSIDKIINPSNINPIKNKTHVKIMANPNSLTEVLESVDAKLCINKDKPLRKAYTTAEIINQLIQDHNSPNATESQKSQVKQEIKNRIATLKTSVETACNLLNGYMYLDEELTYNKDCEDSILNLLN